MNDAMIELRPPSVKSKSSSQDVPLDEVPSSTTIINNNNHHHSNSSCLHHLAMNNNSNVNAHLNHREDIKESTELNGTANQKLPQTAESVSTSKPNVTPHSNGCVGGNTRPHSFSKLLSPSLSSPPSSLTESSNIPIPEVPDKVEEILTVLRKVVHDCTRDDPNRRPSAQEIRESLQSLMERMS